VSVLHAHSTSVPTHDSGRQGRVDADQARCRRDHEQPYSEDDDLGASDDGTLVHRVDIEEKAQSQEERPVILRNIPR